MSEFPILYSFRRCPYAMRARLALMFAGQACELREIVLRDKAPEFLEASPSKTVPTLVLPDGRIIDESLDIMIWAMQQSDSAGSHASGGAFTLIAINDGPFKASLDRYKYPDRHPSVDRDEERGKAALILHDLDRRLQSSGYLVNETLSLTDMAILPFVRQFAQVDRDWFDRQDWPHLLRWLNAFLASELFQAAMTKYPRWNAGDPTTLFAAPCRD
ncbi:MAG: glutathione S-transferase [Phyllobacterium sp.]